MNDRELLNSFASSDVESVQFRCDCNGLTNLAIVRYSDGSEGAFIRSSCSGSRWMDAEQQGETKGYSHACGYVD